MCTRAVGGLAHFFEDEGLATTQISLIRIHTEKISPPRALWVPFELGRPLGAPNNVDFQKKVLLQVLGLLEAKNGPVLMDFPEEVPVSDTPVQPLACPVSFQAPAQQMTETEAKCNAFKREVAAMRTWYDLAVEKRHRTTVGVSGVDFDKIPDFICSFFEDIPQKSLNSNLALHSMLNLAVDDLRAYYTEALTAQPGQDGLSSQRLNDWFWNETLAGEIIFDVRTICKKSSDPFLKLAGNVLLVPAEQVQKRKFVQSKH